MYIETKFLLISDYRCRLCKTGYFPSLYLYLNPISTRGGENDTTFLEAHLLKKFSTEPYPKPLCKIMKNALLFDKKRKIFFLLFSVFFGVVY